MNAIELATSFVPILDEVYQNASLTANLDGAAELASQGANANELIIPMMDMQGMGDYSRNGGYVSGDVNLTNETVKCNYDRGRKFQVDAMDNLETAGIAFGRLAGEFIRTKATPEIDAFRFRERSGLRDMFKILGCIPVRGAGNSAVPEMVGDTDRSQTVFFRVCKQSFRGLLRIVRTGRQTGMDMIVVIKAETHGIIPHFSSFV